MCKKELVRGREDVVRRGSERHKKSRRERENTREREKKSFGREVGVPQLVSTFDFTRELAGIRMGERLRLAGVHRGTMATRRGETSPLDSRTS